MCLYMYATCSGLYLDYHKERQYRNYVNKYVIKYNLGVPLFTGTVFLQCQNIEYKKYKIYTYKV